MRFASVVFVLFSGLMGCDNACQSLCQEMADFGTEECGNSPSDAEVEACMDAFSSPAKDDLQTCREFGRSDVLRREWTCDDVNLFRGSPGDASRVLLH